MSSETPGRPATSETDPLPPAGRRIRGSPWLAVGLIVALVGLFTLRQASNPDVGFHLTAGNHILDGKGWPETDPFTFTVNDHAYIDTSWGFQVVLSLAERAFGAPGMVLLATALVVALFVLLVLTTRLVPCNRHLLALLLLIGALAAEPRFEVRPEIWSYVLLALVLFLLQRRAEGLPSPLWMLPPIFLVWVNSHSLFVLGWGALFCFVVGSWRRRRRGLDLQLLGWAAGSVAVAVVNPYGWRGMAFPFTLITRMQEQNVFSRNIGEFGSPLRYALSDQLTFYLPSIVCFFTLALLVLLSLGRLWRQRRYSCLLLCLTFLPLSLTMVRNVPLLVVVCLPCVVWALPVDSAIGRLKIHGGTRRRLGHVVAAALVLLTGTLALRVVNDAYYISGRRLERFGLGWNGLGLPVDAAAHASAVGLDGRVLNHLNFGGYLMWALREPVFIDGRLEVMGEAFYDEYRRALDSKAGLEGVSARYGIRWIVFPYRLRPDLLRGLSGDRDWKLVYVDALAVIFSRAAGAPPVHDSVRAMAQGATAPPDLSLLPGLNGNPRTAGLGRWLSGLSKRQTYPTDAFNLGVFHYSRADPARAAREFARAIEQSSGAYYEIYNNLGSSLLALGRYAEARECFRVVLRDLPLYRRERRRLVRRRLAEIEERL